MDVSKIRKRDHLLIRVEVSYDVEPGEKQFLVKARYTDLLIAPGDIVAHEPHFEVNEAVVHYGAIGEVLKVRGRTAVVLWNTGDVSAEVLLDELSILKDEPEPVQQAAE